MSNNNYSAQIVKLEQTRLAGMRISTTYATASQDCPALWEAFVKKVGLDQPCEECGGSQSYGVSIMTGPTDFDYLAAIKAPAGGSLPEGLQEFMLPAGPYVKCACPGIDKIGEIYGFIYESPWVAENTDFAVDFTKPCFEGYSDEYVKTGRFAIYAPLKDK